MRRIRQLIWPLIMASYGLAILILMLTDELKTFIHPKLHLLTFLAMVILFILAIATVKETLKKDSVPRLRKTYVVFLIPLVFLFIGTDADASRQIAVENGLKISAVAKVEEDAQDISDELINDDAVANDSLVEATAEEEPLIGEDGVIYLTDLNYAEMMEEIFVHLDDYKGQRVSYVGLLHKDSSDNGLVYVVGRLLMYCCAADAQLIGLQVEPELLESYISGDWVRIVGRIGETEYVDQYNDFTMMIPLLEIEAVESAEEPMDPYVYFNR